jgi:hypothetical protein
MRPDTVAARPAPYAATGASDTPMTFSRRVSAWNAKPWTSSECTPRTSYELLRGHQRHLGQLGLFGDRRGVAPGRELEQGHGAACSPTA